MPIGQQVLRAAIHGGAWPEILYTDNGTPYVAEALERTCGVLGIRRKARLAAASLSAWWRARIW